MAGTVRLLLLTLVVAIAQAQQPPERVVSVPATDHTFPRELASWAPVSGEQISWPSAERSVRDTIEAATACVSDVVAGLIRGSPGDRRAIRTVSGDVVVATSYCDNSSQPCLSGIRDYPDHNEYEIQVPSAAAGRTPQEIIPKLLRWGESPLGIERVQVVSWPDGAVAAFGNMVKSPTLGGLGLTMVFEPKASKVTTRLWLGKSHCRDYYKPDMLFVSHQIPPLSEEAAHWRRDRVVNEAMKEIQGASLNWQPYRLLALLDLLARKNAIAEDLAKICLAEDAARDRFAVGTNAFVRAVEAQPGFHSIAPSGLGQCLAKLWEAPRPFRDSAFGHFFSQRAPGTTDYSAAAREWLRTRQGESREARLTTAGAFSYLAQRAKGAQQVRDLLRLADEAGLREFVEVQGVIVELNLEDKAAERR